MTDTDDAITRLRGAVGNAEDFDVPLVLVRRDDIRLVLDRLAVYQTAEPEPTLVRLRETVAALRQRRAEGRYGVGLYDVRDAVIAAATAVVDDLA